MPRQIALVLLLLLAGCRGSREEASIPAVDFIHDFDRADQRPPRAFTVADTQYPSIIAPAPGRISWALPLPRHGHLHMHVRVDGSAPVRFRVVVSDSRVSENLASVMAPPAGAWTEVTVDLSEYAGRKWSLFYRPETILWHVTLSTDAVEGPSSGSWGAPQVLTDRSSAREYSARRERFRQAGTDR